MFLRPLLITLIWLSTLLLPGCSTGPQLPPLATGDVILAFGDSLTRGTGANEAQSYPAILARLSGHRVINAGIPGETSDRGRIRLPSVLEETQPALLLLCHGGNDMLRKQDLQKTATNLRAMIREAQQRGIAVVLIGVPRPGILLGTAEMYKQVAAEMHVPLEEEVLVEILGKRSMKADHVHPNAAGYNRMAEEIMALLQRRGAL